MSQDTRASLRSQPGGVAMNGHVPPEPAARDSHTCRDTALLALDLGLSAGYPKQDGSKRPDGPWKRYQTAPASRSDVDQWYCRGATGVGLFTGYGNLELLEFDDWPTYERFKEVAEAFGLGGLVEHIEDGYLETTPGGGVHWFYRCEKVEGNTKLAERPESDEAFEARKEAELVLAASEGREPRNLTRGREPLIETRGVGGWVVIAPSNGTVHPSGGRYELVRGGLRSIAEISADDRDALFALSRTLDEIPATPKEPPRPKDRPSGDHGGGISPLDDFNGRADHRAVLESFGWKIIHASGPVEYWRRPGKDDSWSATWGHTKGFRVFTSSTPLAAESHTLANVYCVLKHHGNWTACVKDLVKQGYGTWIDDKGQEHPNPRPTARKAPSKADRPATPAGPGNGDGGGVRSDGSGNDLPGIEISPRRHEALDATMRVLGSDPDLYCRGDTLGLVVAEEGDTATLAGGVTLRNARNSPRFVSLAPSVLGTRLTRLASYFKWRVDRQGEEIAVETHPPDWLIGAVADHRYWPGVRSLLTITECPYVLPDGSIARPGYDPTTGALYRPSFAVAKLPGAPTRADATSAVDRLYELVAQFPFEDMNSFAVWLAYVLTCIQRPAIAGPVPGFAFNGNSAGCGKGLLIDTGGNMVFGSDVPTRAYPADPVEAEKVKLALGLAAVPIVHFDNLTEGGYYGGSVLDSALTSTVTSGRILGQSRDSGSVPLRPVWTLSGNNVSPIKDADRRWLPCNLVTKLERPYERDDIAQKNLRAYVLANRGELVRAALVILEAHALAGRPTNDWPTLGSYDEWDRIVRGAVWYASGLDSLETQRRGAAEKPDRIDKAALLLGWREIDPNGHGCTIEEAIKKAQDDPDGKLYPTLRSALLNLSRDGKLPGVKTVTYKLRSMKQTPIDRMRFETCGENRNGSKSWRVVDC